MNLTLVQELYEGRRAVIGDLAMTEVELSDLRHIRIRKGEIPDGKIFFHALCVYGLRQDGDAALRVPSQCRLCRCLSILFPDRCQQRLRSLLFHQMRTCAPSLADLRAYVAVGFLELVEHERVQL